jgi:tetrahydromethanopterin S-methyltransferase subunit F
MNAFSQREGLIGNYKILIEVVKLPKPSASGTGAKRRVERKRTRTQLIERDAAIDTGVKLRKRARLRRGAVRAERLDKKNSLASF